MSEGKIFCEWFDLIFEPVVILSQFSKHLFMRTICLCLLFGIFAVKLNALAGEDFKFPLYEHDSPYSGTNLWLVSMSRLEKGPRWKIGEKEPPLPVGKAVAIAKKWIVSKGCSKDSCLDELILRPISTYPGELQNICYYNILFGNVGPVGHYRRCIVLMDGTVVEPTLPGIPANKVLYNTWFDE
jgi:hypothetical protein